jgi:hypothetical protein
MIKMLILVCALGIPSINCTEKTADAVLNGPDTASLVDGGGFLLDYVSPRPGSVDLGDVSKWLADHKISETDHYLKAACTTS